MLAISSGNLKFNGRIAAFDLDGTLLGSNVEDFVPGNRQLDKLRQLSKDYDLIIFTNQTRSNYDSITYFMNRVINLIDLPLVIFVATSPTTAKPSIALFDCFVEYYSRYTFEKIKEFTYCGDLLTDQSFYQTIRSKYNIPGQFTFAADYFPLDYHIFQSYHLIILVGYPAAGKSTLARAIKAEAEEKEKEKEFTIVSTDISGHIKKTIQQAKLLLEQGKKIIIDDTNATVVRRAEFIQLYADKSKILILNLNAGFLTAQTRNKLRPKAVPTVALTMFRKRYERPTAAEGVPIYTL